MRRLIALLCWVLMAATPPLSAQTTIHRCIGSSGNPVFTDQPCAALNATPVARAAQPAREGTERSTPAVLCAANMGELRRGVIEAFANRDANRMAGLMLWGGYGRRAAVADIRALQRIMGESLLDVGPPPAAPPPTAPAMADILVLHTSGSDGSGQPRELRYTVVRRSGCLWLSSAD